MKDSRPQGFGVSRFSGSGIRASGFYAMWIYALPLVSVVVPFLGGYLYRILNMRLVKPRKELE